MNGPKRAGIADRVEITNRQLMFSLVGIITGTGILSLPRLAAAETGQDAWISVIIGALAPLLIMLMTILLFKRFPGYTFYQICISTFGKYLGRIPLLIYIIYGFFFCSVISRIISDMLDTYLLPQTPEYVKNAVLMLAVLYIVLSGIKVIVRFNELTYYLFFILYIIVIPSLREAQWTFLLPLAKTPVVKLLSGSMTTAMAFSGMEYLFTLYPFVGDKKKAAKSSIFAIAIVTITFLYFTVVSIAVFGPYSIKRHIWPVLVLLKITEIPVLERLEFFFILMYIGVMFRPIMNQLFAVSYFASQAFGIREYRRTVVPIVIITYALALIPKNIAISFRYAGYMGISGMVIGIGLPTILLLMAIILKKRADTNGQS